MAAFFAENGGTILVLAILSTVLTAVVRSMMRSNKAGKSGCGRGCAGCPSREICHPGQ